MKRPNAHAPQTNGHRNNTSPASKKRKIDPSTIDKERINIFENLSAQQPEIRLRAAADLLAKYSPAIERPREEIEKILTRLVRGLCSSRKAARLGFSVALTEFLTQHVNTLGVRDVWELILKTTALESSSVKGQEARDQLFGKVFGIGAFIQSKVIFETFNDGKVLWTEVVEALVQVMVKTAWLREECGFVFLKALQLLRGTGEANGHAEIVVGEFTKAGLWKTSEGLVLWLDLMDAFTDVELPKKVWSHRNPLRKDELQTVARVLRESVVSSDDPEGGAAIKSQGSWSGKAHFAWTSVFERLLNNESESSKYFSFNDLWILAVDGGLFASKASDERKYWGFQLLETILAVAGTRLSGDKLESVTRSILSPNLVTCAINQSATPNHALHRVVSKTLTTVQKLCKTSSRISQGVFFQIFGTLKHTIFDKQTKGKTVTIALDGLDLDDLPSAIQLISKRARDVLELDEKTSHQALWMIADILAENVKPTPVDDKKEDKDVSKPQSSTSKYALLLEGLLDLVQVTDRAEGLSDPTKNATAQRLLSSLAIVIAWDDSAEQILHDLLASSLPKSIAESDSNFADEVKRTLEKAWSLLRDTRHTHVVLQDQKMKPFRNLWMLTLVLAISGDSEAVGLLDDFFNCYEETAELEAQPASKIVSSTMLEVLLGFLSRPNAALRTLALQSFSAFAPGLDRDALSSLIAILEAKENAAGQETIFESRADQDQGGLDDTAFISGEDDSDVEVSSGSDDSDSSSSDEDASKEEDDNDAELAELDAKLAQALGTRRADQDLAHDESESSDSDMNDEQMAALDTAIENVFREQKAKTRKANDAKDAKNNVIAFKARALDLIERYLKSQFENALAMDLIMPLLHVILRTHTKPLASKSVHILRELNKSLTLKKRREREKDGQGNMDMDMDMDVAEQAAKLLVNVHDLVCSHDHGPFSSACSSTSLYLTKVIVGNGGDIDLAVSQYAHTQGRFLTERKCKVKPVFFTEWNNWCVSARANLL